jgi:hypothetical protein
MLRAAHRGMIKRYLSFYVLRRFIQRLLLTTITLKMLTLDLALAVGRLERIHTPYH